MTNKVILQLAAAVLMMAAARPAHAASVTFNFNSLASGANSAAIQTYMNGVLGGLATVTVSSGAVADAGYNGDGHVIGQGTSTKSATLGDSEGSGAPYSGTTCTTTGCTGTLDTFIRNVSGIASWYFDFSNNFVVDSVSFDYEIFPDGTCTSLPSGCGASLGGGLYANLPDFTFSTDLGQVFHQYASAPVSGQHSPASGSFSTEQAPQKAPVNTALLTANVAGANILTFADWPATIGIDNLTVNWHTGPGPLAAVPEPTSLLLIGTGLAGAAFRRRRQRRI